MLLKMVLTVTLSWWSIHHFIFASFFVCVIDCEAVCSYVYVCESVQELFLSHKTFSQTIRILIMSCMIRIIFPVIHSRFCLRKNVLWGGGISHQLWLIWFSRYTWNSTHEKLNAIWIMGGGGNINFSDFSSKMMYRL